MNGLQSVHDSAWAEEAAWFRPIGSRLSRGGEGRRGGRAPRPSRPIMTESRTCRPHRARATAQAAIGLGKRPLPRPKLTAHARDRGARASERGTAGPCHRGTADCVPRTGRHRQRLRARASPAARITAAASLGT